MPYLSDMTHFQQKIPIRIDYYHGWGLDSRFWGPLSMALNHHPALKSLMISEFFHDRGYFRDSTPHPISTGSISSEVSDFESEAEPLAAIQLRLRILLAHSFGLHFIPEEVLSKADLIITMAAFDAFDHSDSPSQPTPSPLAAMIDAWQRSPRVVLSRFHRLNFAPDEPQSELLPINADNANLTLLLQDLQKMRSSRINHTIFRRIPGKLQIQGNSDRIVSVKTAEAFNREFPDTQLVLHPTAGHALAATHYNFAAEYVARFIKDHLTNDVS